MEMSMVHAHRWQDVKFWLPNGSFSKLDLRDVSLPMLQSISLHSAFSDEIGVDIFTLTDAPSLRHADVSASPPVKIVIPWARMTTLTLLHNIRLTECMSLLEECQSLVNLTVSTTGPAAAHTDLVTLTSLKTLVCNLGDSTVLEHLALPHLLRLTVTSLNQARDATIFSTFINRSACPLQFFAVHGTAAISLSVLVPVLRAIPDSTWDVEFTWHTSRFTVHLFSALQSMDILPGLKYLRLRARTRMYDREYHELLEVLRARVEAKSPRVPLESITLEIAIKQPLSIQIMPRNSRIARFRELASTGLQINFTIESFDSSTHVVLNSSVQD
ncbi:hypothetical protein MSAN_00444400 [Mycena sanguinolenta]|uniref:F-box domain-containing protein n=1 Tax=Mycena sanguinolenta TaxID=230812 RepID=A0A8H6ZDU2_9AGAR|nr:hypothetical protein MSAN_00444400 [Mycena sanguinolenta]